jgi:tetratricopeptide (TPR) repeat protein
MAVCAGYGVDTLLSMWKERRYKQVIINGIVFAGLFIGFNLPGEGNADMSIEFNRMGTLYNRAGQTDKAYRWYGGAYKANPSNPQTLYNLGIAARKLGRYNEALGWFNKSLTANNSNPLFVAQSYYELGVTYYQMGKIERAVKLLKKAVGADTGYESALNLLAVCYAVSGRGNEAEQLWKQLLHANKTHLDANYNLGVWYFHRGDRLMAKKFLREVARQNPDYKDVGKYLAQLR